jgi:hypothetical protein
MDEQEQSQSEELEEGEATVLPASEAMSLITQDASGKEDLASEGPSEELSNQDSSSDT